MKQYNYSIIIPHYNIPHLLVRCLNSIPKRDDIQIIVVDDNSTNADSYISSYPVLNQDNLTLVLNRQNVGGGGCRNIGMQYATGKWLVFADADDFFNPCFNELLDKHILSNADIIYFKINSLCSDTYENSDRDIYINRRVNMFLEDSKFGENVLRYATFSPWSKFIKRDLVVSHGIRFEETLKYNDVGFSYHIGHYAKSIEVCPIALYCNTSRKNSVSTVCSEEAMYAVIEVYSRYYAFLKEHGLTDNIKILNRYEVKKQLLALRDKSKDAYRKGLSIAVDNMCPESYLSLDILYVLKQRIKQLLIRKRYNIT